MHLTVKVVITNIFLPLVITNIEPCFVWNYIEFHHILLYLKFSDIQANDSRGQNFPL